MANTSMRGFRWVRSLIGGASDGVPPTVKVRLASGLVPQIGGAGAYNINVGDPLSQIQTGYHVPTVGSEGTQLSTFGIVAGFDPIYNSVTGRREMLKAFPSGGGVYGTNLENMTWAHVIPVFGQVFEIDADDGAAANDTEAEWLALVGQNADHVLTSGITPDLNPLLDISSANTTATLQWRILGVSPRVDNDLTATRAKVQVVCNFPQMAGMPSAATIIVGV